ncbi:hypothetical protein DS739_10755 [Acetobacter sp. JWB]|nr:hypothetical protein CPF11_09645 [Acetobacter pomorum]AXC27178.1 hypothetical protein DS739_10755 [Acetobacter sp. JWB]
MKLRDEKDMVHSRLWLPRYDTIAREPYTLLLAIVLFSLPSSLQEAEADCQGMMSAIRDRSANG